MFMSIDQSSQKKIVRDSMGELEIDHDALYAAQTQRAINNFPVSGRKLPKKFIEALILIKLNFSFLKMFHVFVLF